jgi:cytochrome P450
MAAPRSVGRRSEERRQANEGLPPSVRLPMPVQTLWFWGLPLHYLQWCRHRYGSRFTLRAIGHPPLVFLSDPTDIRTMFAAPADVLAPGEGGAAIMPIVGDRSFMLLDGDEHLAGRRAILPFYRSGFVQRHEQLVRDLVEREVASWPREVPIALHPRLRALALEIVLHTIFASAPEDRLLLLRDRLLAMFSINAGPLLSLATLRRGPGALIWSRFLRHRAEVDELIGELVRARRGEGGGESRNGDHDEGEGGDDVLAWLLSARGVDGAPLGAQDLRDDVMSVVLAGHETTASELAWTFQLLAHHPSAQQRLIGELASGSGDAYLMATIHEALRHRPVFLFTIPRAVLAPMRIGERIYRPPAHLLGCIYLMHHDPARYRRPEQFRPERFLNEEVLPEAPGWIPWGGGRKRCPGLHMATLEMQVVLRTVFAQASISPARRRLERARWRSVVVTPHHGSRVVLHPR